jgi:hypothetical protein
LLSFLIGLHQVVREPTRTQYDPLTVIPRLRSAATDPDAYLGMGSLPNFPLLHHTVIGLEALEQMEMAGYWSDIIIGCVGGGSYFSGLAALFLGKMLREKCNEDRTLRARRFGRKYPITLRASEWRRTFQKILSCGDVRKAEEAGSARSMDAAYDIISFGKIG